MFTLECPFATETFGFYLSVAECAAAALWIVDHDTKTLWTRAAHGNKKSDLLVRRGFGVGIVGAVAETGVLSNVCEVRSISSHHVPPPCLLLCMEYSRKVQTPLRRTPFQSLIRYGRLTLSGFIVPGVFAPAVRQKRGQGRHHGFQIQIPAHRACFQRRRRGRTRDA
jgi:hypothetical protein